MRRANQKKLPTGKNTQGNRERDQREDAPSTTCPTNPGQPNHGSVGNHTSVTREAPPPTRQTGQSGRPTTTPTQQQDRQHSSAKGSQKRADKHRGTGEAPSQRSSGGKQCRPRLRDLTLGAAVRRTNMPRSRAIRPGRPEDTQRSNHRVPSIEHWMRRNPVSDGVLTAAHSLEAPPAIGLGRARRPHSAQRNLSAGKQGQPKRPDRRYQDATHNTAQTPRTPPSGGIGAVTNSQHARDRTQQAPRRITGPQRGIIKHPTGTQPVTTHTPTPRTKP